MGSVPPRPEPAGGRRKVPAVPHPSIRALRPGDAPASVGAPSGTTGRLVAWRGWLAAAILTFCLSTVPALAGSGSSESTLVNVADTRGLPPGLSHWIADVYNQSLWLYGLTVVLVMAGMGLAFGLLTDRLVGMLGVHLGRTTHWE